MKKGIWVMLLATFLLFVVVLTFYFEKSIQSKENPLLTKSSEQTITRTNLVPIEEVPFSVNVTEELSEVAEEENSQWYCGEVEIESEVDASDFMIVLEYTNVENTPKAAICYTPDFSESYTANSINENMSGEILFKPQTFTKGVWYVMLHGSGALGTYTAYGISGSEYDKIKNPVILKPRDLDAPGALLPDEE